MTLNTSRWGSRQSAAAALNTDDIQQHGSKKWGLSTTVGPHTARKWGDRAPPGSPPLTVDICVWNKPTWCAFILNHVTSLPAGMKIWSSQTWGQGTCIHYLLMDSSLSILLESLIQISQALKQFKSRANCFDKLLVSTFMRSKLTNISFQY